jgi:DNA-binding response OmpR family regulator
MAAYLTVLLVEDDPDLLDALAVILRRHGYRVVTAADGNVAADLIRQELPDVAVVDMLLPGRSGFQLTDLLRERSNGRVPVVMISGHASAAHRDFALATGVDRFLAKPFSLAKLVDTVQALTHAAASVPATAPA